MPLLIVAMMAVLWAAEAPTAHAEHLIPDERIEEARHLLNAASIGTRRIGGTEAVIAVWRPGSDEPVRAIPVRKGVSQDPSFTVQLLRRAGVGSVYAVLEPEGYVMLGIRTNVADLTGRPWVASVTAITAAPPVGDAARAEAGLRYLRGVVRAARERLDARDVRSLIAGRGKARAGALVSDETLMAILIVERVAPEIAAGVPAVVAIERALATLALNPGTAFSYATSPVGARGIAQFMPATYRETRLAYRSARLVADFIRGTRDHGNAVAAQACLADAILAKLTPRQLARFVAAGDEEIGAYVAAAYNGGNVYALRALNGPFAQWDTYRRKRGLLKPTVHYVAVFRIVHRYLNAHTPG